MILQHIRSHTTELHEALEAKLGGKLLTPKLTPSTYHQLLTAFYTSYHALEKATTNIPAVVSLMKERSKLSWLEKDMSYLQPFSVGNDIGLSAENIPQVSNCATALGMMYVMEGATLGGRQIVNYLLNFDWIDLDTCLNFFNSYGDQRGKMWKEFTAMLEEYARNHPTETGDILSGAYKAFGCIDQAITQVLTVVNDKA